MAKGEKNFVKKLPATWFQHERDPLAHFDRGQLLKQRTIQALVRMVHCEKKKKSGKGKSQFVFQDYSSSRIEQNVFHWDAIWFHRKN